MKRRAALAALVFPAIASVARAQATQGVRRIGYLSGGMGAEVIAKPLAQFGWVEGRNLHIDVRIVPGDPPELAAVAAEMASSKVDVLLTFSSHRAVALGRATKTIPIVAGLIPDPVGAGLAQTLARPGSNVTGISLGIPEIADIQVGLLQTVRPALKRIAAMVPFAGPSTQAALQSIASAANRKGIAWELAAPATANEVDRLFLRLGDAAQAAIYLGGMPETITWPDVKPIAFRRRMATIVGDESFVRDGALMYYAVDHEDPFRRAAALIDKVLRGANPAELPFELPDRTSFVFNRTTAKAIGANTPPELLVRVTEMVA